jgi:flagellar hook-associated protein 1 FlgK
MLSLLDTLNIGASGLEAQQTGLTVTGQNIANQNNSAYTRQVVDLSAGPDIQTPNGFEGTGVQVSTIQQISDSALNGQICNQNSTENYWNTQQSNLENIQTELGQFLNTSSSSVDGTTGSDGTASSEGLSSQINSLFNGFESVASDPTSLSERQALVSQAQTLAGSFNQINTQLSGVESNINGSIDTDVASANQLMSNIASLNGQIAMAEAGTNNTANDLRDQREQDLENLSQLGNFQISTATDGTVSIVAGPYTMVSGSKVVSTLGTENWEGSHIVYSTTDNASVTFTGGSIAGEMDARDGALADLQSGVNTLASQLITQVNSVYSPGYDLNGNTGADFFTGTDASSIGVNSNLLTDPSQVQAAGTAGAASDNTVALALGQLATTSQSGLNNETFSDNFSLLVSGLGNSLSNANDQVASQQAVTQMLQNQRGSISGVSLDEEMTNMLTYQKAYQASAQVVSTVNEMLETLISMKTV